MSRLNDLPVSARTPVAWLAIAAILTIVGIVAFAYGIMGDLAPRAWQIYLINYVFWTGLAFGAVLFSAVLNLSKAVWGRPLKRLAESFSFFLPLSFLLFWVIWPGRNLIFRWLTQPVPEKVAFLNAPFLFAREGVGLFVLTALSLILVYYSVAADRHWMDAGRPEVTTVYPWTGFFRSQWRLSPVLPVVYAFVISVFAIDLVMSLDPEWYSTLFPGYFFIAAFYAAVVAIYLFALLAQHRLGLAPFLFPRQFHDLGKMTFGFAIFTGYLFYAQLLVIWYGNLPEETRFVILRTKLDPWKPLAWTILFMIFIIPFFVLLSRRIKIKRLPMIFITSMILVGLWLERYLLVVPSLWRENPAIPFGLLEIMITAGFFGLVWLCVTLFLSRFPVLPVSDPLFHKFIKEPEGTLKP